MPHRLSETSRRRAAPLRRVAVLLGAVGWAMGCGQPQPLRSDVLLQPSAAPAGLAGDLQLRSSDEVSDEELAAFVRTFTKVANVQIHVRRTLQQMGEGGEAPDPMALQALEQQANQWVAAAIRSEGLDPEGYRALLASVEADEALSQRAAAELKTWIAAQREAGGMATQPAAVPATPPTSGVP